MKNALKENRQFLIFVTSIIVLMGFLGVVFSALYRNVRNDNIVSKRAEVAKVAEKVNDFLEEGTNALKLSAYQVEAMMDAGTKPDEILRYLSETYHAYSRVIDSDYSDLYGVFQRKFLDGSGWVPGSDYIAESRPWYLAARNAGEEVAAVSSYYDMATGNVMMSLSKCLSDQRSVISIDISLDKIRKIVKSFAVENDQEIVMVLDKDCFVVAHSDRTQIGADYAKEEGTLGRAIADSFLSESDKDWYEISFDSVGYLLMTAETDQGWKAVTLSKTDDLMGTVNFLIFVMVLSMAVIICAIFIVYMNFRKKRHEAVKLNNQLQAVAGIYEAMYQVNLREDTFQEIKVNDETKQILGEKTDQAQYCIRTVMDELTEGHFKKSVFDFIDFSTLDARLSDNRSILREFVSNRNERCSVRFVPVTRDEEGKLETIIVLVERYI